MYQLYESREHFFLMNMSGPTCCMLGLFPLFLLIMPTLQNNLIPFLMPKQMYMPKPFFRLLLRKQKRIEFIPTYRINIPLPPFPGLSYFLYLGKSSSSVGWLPCLQVWGILNSLLAGLPLLPPTGNRIATRERHGTGFLPLVR